MVVVAHFENAQTEERMALRKGVEIKEELVCWAGLVAEKEFSPERFGANMIALTLVVAYSSIRELMARPIIT